MKKTKSVLKRNPVFVLLSYINHIHLFTKTFLLYLIIIIFTIYIINIFDTFLLLLSLKPLLYTLHLSQL